MPPSCHRRRPSPVSLRLPSVSLRLQSVILRLPSVVPSPTHVILSAGA
jgi:hypothetical protein